MVECLRSPRGKGDGVRGRWARLTSSPSSSPLPWPFMQLAGSHVAQNDGKNLCLLSGKLGAVAADVRICRPCIEELDGKPAGHPLLRAHVESAWPTCPGRSEERRSRVESSRRETCLLFHRRCASGVFARGTRVAAMSAWSSPRRSPCAGLAQLNIAQS
jgi:hypothetical protein